MCEVFGVTRSIADSCNAQARARKVLWRTYLLHSQRAEQDVLRFCFEGFSGVEAATCTVSLSISRFVTTGQILRKRLGDRVPAKLFIFL